MDVFLPTPDQQQQLTVASIFNLLNSFSDTQIIPFNSPRLRQNF